MSRWIRSIVLVALLSAPGLARAQTEPATSAAALTAERQKVRAGLDRVNAEIRRNVDSVIEVAEVSSASVTPPPPLFRDPRFGVSLSFLRRTGFEGLAASGVAREPDSDFSSLPMLPPELPDCACAGSGRATMASMVGNSAALDRYRMRSDKIDWFPMNRL
jgi:hypothetical protein